MVNLFPPLHFVVYLGKLRLKDVEIDPPDRIPLLGMKSLVQVSPVLDKVTDGCPKVHTLRLRSADSLAKVGKTHKAAMVAAWEGG